MRLIVITLFLGVMGWGYAFEKVNIQYGDKDIVNVFLSGRIYKEGIDITSTGRKFSLPADEVKVIEFLGKVYEANRNGKPSDILKLWDDKDKDNVSKMVMNQDMFQKNRNVFAGMDSVTLKAIFLYQGMYVALVEHNISSGKIILRYPVLKKGESLFLSNQLNGDPFYDYILQNLLMGKQKN